MRQGLLAAILSVLPLAAMAQDFPVPSRRCVEDMAASRAASERSVASVKTYEASRSEADFCASVDAMKVLIAAADRGIRSCEKQFPEEMVKEREAHIRLGATYEKLRPDYARRCTVSGRDAAKRWDACVQATKAATEAEHLNGYVAAHGHLVKSQPSPETCTHRARAIDGLVSLTAVFKACRGVPDGDYGAASYREMENILRTALSKHRKEHPNLCSSR